MKRKFNNILTGIVFLCTMTSLVGCSDWTDEESITINEPDIANQNAELYAQYLTKLKAFKASKHKISIGWFDNSNKQPINQAQHISAVPDSLDYISLMTPDTLSQRELDEIQMVREKKSIKVIYTIDFDAIKLIYDTRAKVYAEKKAAAELKGEKLTYDLPIFNSFLIDSVKTALSLAIKYKYDGINIAYKGKYKYHMSETDKTAYTGYENDFLGVALDWISRHTDKELFFQGKPQNVIDQTILNSCKYIIIPCFDVSSYDGVTYQIEESSTDGVPTDKFIPMVQTSSLDTSDLKTGYWINQVSAINGTALWVAAEHDNFTIVGLGIYNISNDYYNPSFTYSHIRYAITTINPSVKN